MGDEAISIVQRFRPGAEPSAFLEKFRKWGVGRPAKGWQKTLQSWARNERLSEDEMRAEQIAIANGIGPRDKGESVEAYRKRSEGGAIDPRVLAAIRTVRGS